MQVKVCGLTRAQDVRLATELGASSIGLVLSQGLARSVTIEDARELVDAAPTEVRRVLVFRDPTSAEVLRAALALGVRDVQIHHARPMRDVVVSTPDDGAALPHQRMREGDPLAVTLVSALEDEGLRVTRAVDGRSFPASALDLATEHRPILCDHGQGGTGERFDWTGLAGRNLAHVSIAGGITPENVHELAGLDLKSIDVSSGVESAPGIKDPERLRALFEAVRALEASAGTSPC